MSENGITRNNEVPVAIAMGCENYSVCTFNLRGLRSGMSILADLCTSSCIIAVQEHWLRKDELFKLNDVHKGFYSIGISSMNQKCEAGLLVGRPFGGLAFLINRKFKNNVEYLACSDRNRCLAIRVSTAHESIIMFNVYFPCRSSCSTNEYIDELSNVTGFMEFIVTNNAHDLIIICGDTNFDLKPDNAGYNVLHDFMNSMSLIACDHLVKGPVVNTYFSEALKCESKIDHFFVSSSFLPKVNHIEVVDSGANLSDHRPVILKLETPLSKKISEVDDDTRTNGAHMPYNKTKEYKLRWDKCDLCNYYNATLSELMHPHNMKFLENACNVDTGTCSNKEHMDNIDRHYNSIVNALRVAEKATVPQIPVKALKGFWNEQLSELKSKSIFWHKLWLDSGKPGSGLIHKIKCSTKLYYKQAIRKAQFEHENQYNEELFENYLNKKPKDFWKTWSKKCKENSRNNAGMNINPKDDLATADAFANSFQTVYSTSINEIEAVNEFNSLLNNMTDTTNHELQVVTNNIVACCINKLNAGKASGPDGLATEHILHAHPLLVTHLTKLFNDILVHAYVPLLFGSGVVIPIIKDKSGNISDPDNYRGITLIPILAKLFEIVIYHLFEDLFETDDLQFGFKKNVGCPEALFVLQETIQYFTDRGSSVFAAMLDFKKAFDKVNHFKLFSTLIKKKFPKYLVLLIVNWYDKFVVRVRWGNALSKSFAVHSGVRQGSTLSPMLFNIFVNDYIDELRHHDIGCKINNKFVGVILYADDIIILSASVRGLQKMLDICSNLCTRTLLQFNCAKCKCFVVGKRCFDDIPHMVLCNQQIDWTTSVNYLGLHFFTGKRFGININAIKRKFYASCNSLLWKMSNVDELVKLQLAESFCCSVLMYGVHACRLTRSQLNELNICWNSVYRRIFGFHRWESVKPAMFYLNRLDLTRQLVKRKLQFCLKERDSKNEVLNDTVFRYCLSAEFNYLCSNYNMPSVSICSLNHKVINYYIHKNFEQLLN